MHPPQASRADGVAEPPGLSILMVTHGAWDWTARALAALEAHTETPCEIIVVDNASTDGTPAQIRERFPAVRLVEHTTNTGFGAANNHAAGLARAPVIALINSDAVVGPGWDVPLLRALARPGVGAVVPALLNVDGSLQGAGAIVGPDGSVVNIGTGENPDDDAFRFPRAIDFGAAACMLVRREIFVDLGGFDAAYEPAYFEDVDLCMRLAQRGLRTMFVPAVRVVHKAFASGSMDNAVALFGRNRPVFVARWGDRLAASHPPSLWPVDPKTSLQARDASATCRALVRADAVPAAADATGRALIGALALLPWMRLTLVAASGGADDWLARGVEVMLGQDFGEVLRARSGHYEVVVAGEGWGTAVAHAQPRATLLTAADQLVPHLTAAYG